MLHRKCSLVVFLLLPLLLAGCSPVERQAYNIVVGAKGFLDAERKAHVECTTSGVSSFCGKLSQAVSAKDALIDAVEVYCSGPAFETGGACQPPAKGTDALAQATAKIKAAIAIYEQAEKDLKGAKS